MNRWVIHRYWQAVCGRVSRRELIGGDWRSTAERERAEPSGKLPAERLAVGGIRALKDGPACGCTAVDVGDNKAPFIKSCKNKDLNENGKYIVLYTYITELRHFQQTHLALRYLSMDSGVFTQT